MWSTAELSERQTARQLRLSVCWECERFDNSCPLSVLESDHSKKKCVKTRGSFSHLHLYIFSLLYVRNWVLILLLVRTKVNQVYFKQVIGHNQTNNKQTTCLIDKNSLVVLLKHGTQNHYTGNTTVPKLLKWSLFCGNNIDKINLQLSEMLCLIKYFILRGRFF